jgi:hypothetical protein
MVESFQRYLRAKRTVDDRSLDGRLVDRLRDGLTERAAGREGPLRVLGIGAGVGTMVARFVEWGVLPEGRVEYAAVDADAATARAIPGYLSEWAAGRDIEVRKGDATTDLPAVELAGGGRRVTVDPVVAEAAPFVAAASREWDLLVGAALLDIVPLDRLPTLLSALAPGGYWYFPITFDGGTRFVPDHPADDAVEDHYHRHMDGKPGGDSRAGSHTLQRLQSLDAATVEGVAGSDWIVRPADGGYPGDEAFFLRYILGTVESALGDLDRRDGLDDATLADWLSTRRKQVGHGELTYVTHQLDLLGLGRYREGKGQD